MKNLATIVLVAAVGGTILGCDYGRSATSGDAVETPVACPDNIPQAADARTKSGYVHDVQRATPADDDFRRVLYTGKNLQLVQMTIEPGEHLGAEIHTGHDLFFRIEEGQGEVQINSDRTPIAEASSIVVPADALSDVVNTGSTPLRLLTVYSPPEHRRNAVRKSKADSGATPDHFDGCLSE